MSNERSSPPNVLNYLNLFGYIVNLFVTYGIGIYGLFGLESNQEVSHKYQTVITPAGWAFSIWGLIFLSQAVFAVAQMLPSYRDSALVQKGVGYFYFATCIFQSLWTFAFCSEKIMAAYFGMVAILVSLLLTVSSQRKNQSEDKLSTRDYFLLKFPFEIHCGWIIAASTLNVSVLLVAFSTPASSQVVIGAISLVSLLVAAAVGLFSHSRPLYVIALVLSWAAIGIWGELGSPMEVIQDRFTSNQITLVRRFSFFVFVIGLHLVMIKLASAYFRNKKAQTEEGGQVEGEGEGETVYLNADSSGTAITTTAENS